MTKWIVSAPLKGTDLMKNFVCFTEVELRKLLEQYPDASVEMKDSHLEDHAPLPLTDDQQEVLEWLQIYADKDSGDKPFQTIFFLWDCIKSNNLGNDELTALRKLTRAEQFQVLAAFAEWGLKEGSQ